VKNKFMAYNKWLWLLLTVLTGQTVFSQSLDEEKLNRYFQALEANDKFMGNIMLYQNGKKIYSFSAGYSNIKTKAKSNKNTTYRIGSISKTFTATLVLKAVEEGRIQLSQNIGTFFPSIKNADKITIGQLLNHHSGIHNFTGGAEFMKWRTQYKSEKELIDIIAAGGSDFEPGNKAWYSNSNYVLLSYILEHVYNKPYAAILSEKIISPLHLQHTQFGDSALSANAKTWSYTFELGWNLVEETNLSIPMGAGGIVLTGDDLALFLDALFGNRIISKEMVQEMEAQTDGFGFGLFKKPFLETTGYGHDGNIDGYNSYFYYFPNKHLTYVLLSNAEDYNLNDINNSVLDWLFDKPFEIPVFNAYKVLPDDLLPYAGVYTSNASPLAITIWNNGKTLLAQPKGQQVYTMDATDKNKFKHDKSGVTLEFVPSENKMIMKQGQQTLVFTKH
jgi:D-alanyl-D-alanine carboxypeptidase